MEAMKFDKSSITDRVITTERKCQPQSHNSSQADVGMHEENQNTAWFQEALEEWRRGGQSKDVGYGTLSCGAYNEAQNAACFQEALNNWRITDNTKYSGTLSVGEYNEADSAGWFQEALAEWRTSGQCKDGGAGTLSRGAFNEEKSAAWFQEALNDWRTEFRSKDGIGGTLSRGMYNEELSAASFQDALNDWKKCGPSKVRIKRMMVDSSSQVDNRPDVQINFRNNSLSFLDRMALKHYQQDQCQPGEVSTSLGHHSQQSPLVVETGTSTAAIGCGAESMVCGVTRADGFVMPEKLNQFSSSFSTTSMDE